MVREVPKASQCMSPDGHVKECFPVSKVIAEAVHDLCATGLPCDW